jgi:phospholipid/cholesterol/gamma-HCH transport system substrate-binding protein
MGKEAHMKKGLFSKESLTEIVVGLFVAALLAGLAYFTFVVTDTRMGKETHAMDVVFRDVMGLRERDSVVVRGMPVGEVVDLRLDTDGVYVKLELKQKLDMRKNYTVSIVPSSVFGGRFVKIDEGTPDADSMPPTHLFIGEPPRDLMDDAAEVMSAARKDVAGEGGIIDNLREATAQIRDVTDRLNRGEGVLGKLLSPDETLYNDLRDGLASVKTIVDRVEQGQGALGKLMSTEDTIYNDLQASVASLREISRRLEAGEGLMGRLFAPDDTLYRQLEEMLAEARAALDDVRETTPVVTFTSVLFGAF